MEAAYSTNIITESASVDTIKVDLTPGEIEDMFMGIFRDDFDDGGNHPTPVTVYDTDSYKAQIEAIKEKQPNKNELPRDNFKMPELPE